MTRRRFTPTQRAAGFTLIELMVTVSLMATLMMVAVPSFQAFKRSSELSAATNSFVALLARARTEAMKRGLNTVVVPSDGRDWAKGWTAFIDKSVPANNLYDPATDELIGQSGDALPPHLSVTKSNAASFFKYNGSGFTVVGAGLGNTTIEIARSDVGAPDLLAYTRRIKVSPTGRVRVCTPRSSTDADCDATGL